MQSVNREVDNQLVMSQAGAAMLLNKEAAVDEPYKAIQGTLKLDARA